MRSAVLTLIAMGVLAPFGAGALAQPASTAPAEAPVAAPTPEYMLPWEVKAAKERENASKVADAVLVLEVPVGKMELIKLMRAGTTVISSHPELADIYLENPNLLFVFARRPGETHVVVADKALKPVWEGSILVLAPDGAQKTGEERAVDPIDETAGKVQFKPMNVEKPEYGQAGPDDLAPETGATAPASGASAAPTPSTSEGMPLQR